MVNDVPRRHPFALRVDALQVGVVGENECIDGADALYETIVEEDICVFEDLETIHAACPDRRVLYEVCQPLYPCNL